MPGLELHLLGQFRAIVDGVEVEEQRWTRKKARLLVKLLALAPGRKMHREQLIDVLWPDVGAELAINNLHKVVHAARRALEPGLAQGAQSRFILTHETQLALAGSDDVRIDAEEFERLAAEALRSRETEALEAALILYQGDLLEEDLYEDWVSVRRERLCLTFQRTLDSLAGNYESANDERAIGILHRLLTLNPANEEAHRSLMRFHASQGQRHLALEQYRICREALKRELNTEPEAATVRLQERILAGESAGIVAPAPARPDRPAAAQPRRQAPQSRFRWAAVMSGAIVITSLAAVGYSWFGTHHVRPSSLAVLPLRTLGGDDSLEYLADGITDALINNASRLPGMKVMARSTVFAYKNHRADPRQIGRELKVSHILSGRVEAKGSALTVGVELVEVEDGSRVWARLYSVAPKDIASIQQLLNSELAAALKVKLTDVERRQQTRATTGDAEAYRLYLTGRHFWNQRTVAGFRKSIEYYQQAIDRDDNYALAYAGLADSYGLLGFQSGLPADYYPKARDAASKALALDESLAEAQTSLAMVSALFDWNWPTAEAQFRRATDLNPGYATAHHWFGVHLCAMGRFDEAQQELDHALSLDPLSAIVNFNHGYPAFFARHYPQALEAFDRALVLSPGFPPAHDYRLTLFSVTGRRADAAREAIAWLGADRTPLAEAIEKKAGQGDISGALREWLRAYENGVMGGYTSPMKPGAVALWLGDSERAFLYFDRALEQRSPQLVYIAVDPKYDPIREDPRFSTLLKRIGLPGR